MPGDPKQPLPCVAFMLVRNDEFLAERRKLTKNLAPGAVALPGGHLEASERLEDGLRRELGEELGVVPTEMTYVCTLLHYAEEVRRIHYFAVEGWRGEIANQEAAALLWIPLGAADTLDFDVDRTAVQEYRRARGRGSSRGAE